MSQLTVLQNSPQEILHAQQSLWQQLFTAVITVNGIVCELSYQQTPLNLLLELPQYPKTASNSVPLTFNSTASSQAFCHTPYSAAANEALRETATNKGHPQARQGHERPSSISDSKQSTRSPSSLVSKVPSGEPEEECERARPAQCQRRSLHRRCNHGLQPELEVSRTPNFVSLAFSPQMSLQSLRHSPCLTAVTNSNEAPHNHAKNGQPQVRQGHEASPSIRDNKVKPRSPSAAEVKIQSGKREDRAKPAQSFSVVQARHRRKPPLITSSFAIANPFAALSQNKKHKVSKSLHSAHEENHTVNRQRGIKLSVHKHPKVLGMKKRARYCRSIGATSPRIHPRMPAPLPSNVWNQKERVPQQRVSPTIIDMSNDCGTDQEMPPLESSSSSDSASALDAELAEHEENGTADNDDNFNQAEGESASNTKVLFITPSLVGGQNMYSQQLWDADAPHYRYNASLNNHTQRLATGDTEPPTPHIYKATATLHNTDTYHFDVITSDIFFNGRSLPFTYRLTHSNILML